MKLLKIILVLLLVGFFGCDSIRDAEETETIARVDDEVLTLEEARNRIPDHLLKQDSIRSIKNLQEDWVRKKLLVKEAERLNLTQNESVQAKLETAREEVLNQALKDHILQAFEEDSSISDSEAQNYYQRNKDQFVLDEDYVQFRHMETENRQQAQSAREALMQGREWSEVANEYAINPDEKIRNSEQYWPISMALPELGQMNNYLQRIGRTEISNIQQIGDTHHFVQLVDTRAAGEHPDLEWLMDQIKEWMMIDKKRRHFNSYVNNLYLNANSNNEIDTLNVVLPNSDN